MANKTRSSSDKPAAAVVVEDDATMVEIETESIDIVVIARNFTQ